MPFSLPVEEGACKRHAMAHFQCHTVSCRPCDCSSVHGCLGRRGPLPLVGAYEVCCNTARDCNASLISFELPCGCVRLSQGDGRWRDLSRTSLSVTSTTSTSRRARLEERAGANADDFMYGAADWHSRADLALVMHLHMRECTPRPQTQTCSPPPLPLLCPANNFLALHSWFLATKLAKKVKSLTCSL